MGCPCTISVPKRKKPGGKWCGTGKRPLAVWPFAIFMRKETDGAWEHHPSLCSRAASFLIPATPSMALNPLRLAINGTAFLKFVGTHRIFAWASSHRVFSVAACCPPQRFVFCFSVGFPGQLTPYKEMDSIEFSSTISYIHPLCRL